MEEKMLELKDICFNVRQDSKEKEILKHSLISAGYMKENEDLSDEELDKLMKFIKNNKEFIK